MVLGVPWAAKPFSVQCRNTKVHIEKRQFIMLYYVVLLNCGCMKSQLLESRSFSWTVTPNWDMLPFVWGSGSRFFVLFFLSPATYQT